MIAAIRRRIADALAIARLKRAGAPFPPVAPVTSDDGFGEHRSERVFIGPANSAGQGYRWARALEAVRPGTRVTSMAFQRTQNPFAYPIDQAVPSAYAAHSPAWQRRQHSALIGDYRAAIIESAQPPFSRYRGLDAVAQIAELRDAGIACALLFHGSDLRDPDRHLANEAHSHFGADPDFCTRMRQVTARSRRVIAQSGLPVFVSTPDLLSEVDGARWLPVVIDVDAWTVDAPPLPDGRIPRVVHVPSDSYVKGTELVQPMLERLHAAGTIEYRAVSGVPHAEMPGIYREADIVIDQFRVGNYGVAACEALAAGRVVVSHVSDEVRTRTRELTGADLPIIEATPDTLESVLTGILGDRSAARARAAEGPAFARAWHDGTRSGAVLADWLEEHE
ncbi:hypothetical protein [Leucobacter sp. GX24907]